MISHMVPYVKTRNANGNNSKVTEKVVYHLYIALSPATNKISEVRKNAINRSQRACSPQQTKF